MSIWSKVKSLYRIESSEFWLLYSEKGDYDGTTGLQFTMYGYVYRCDITEVDIIGVWNFLIDTDIIIGDWSFWLMLIFEEFEALINK